MNDYCRLTVMKVAANATDFRLRRRFVGCCCCCDLEPVTTGNAMTFVNTFVDVFVLVAFFSLAKNSLFINFGLFDNGIYVPCSKHKNKKKKGKKTISTIDTC